MDLAFRQLTLYYEISLNPNRNISIGIPLSTSFRTFTGGHTYYDYLGGYYNSGKLISTGIDIMLFPYSSVNNGLVSGLSFKGGVSEYFNYDHKTKVYSNLGSLPYFGLYWRAGYFYNRSLFAASIYLDSGLQHVSYYNGSGKKKNYDGVGMILHINLGLTF